MTILLASFFWTGKISQESCPVASKSFSIQKPSPAKPVARGDDAFRLATEFYKANRWKIKNKRYLTIIDYTKPSCLKRMAVIDFQKRTIETYLVAHGKNSGWIYANDFSNRVNSYKSSRGFFLTGQVYCGTHGTTLQLYGLQKGVNDNALERGIVLHGADYVSPRSIVLNGGRLGRSLGCPAVPLQAIDHIAESIKGGSLLYIHAPS